MSVTTTTEQSTVDRSSAVRDPFLDNARYWVMLLVVVGHFLTELIDRDTARAAYHWIYLFHMPVFVLVSGYAARNYSGSPRQIRRIVSTLVLPYLLVEAGLETFEAWLAGEALTLHVLEPDWLTWFIAALFVWRLTTPLWRAIRWPLPVAIGCSLIGGLAPVSDVLAIPQIIGFLPFYVAGMQLRREHFDQLRHWSIRLSAVIALAFAAYVCTRIPEGWNTTWLYWRDAYSEPPLSAAPLDGIAMRTTLLAVGFLLAAAVLALVPHSRHWFSRMGERTLYCYLLHGFVILWLNHYGAFGYLLAHGTIGIAIAALAGLAVAQLLMTKPIAYGFRPLFEPQLRWLFISDSPKTPAPR